MGEPVAVLVVPAKGDPGGLLAAGRCGTWPPASVCLGDEGWRVGIARALPLWWDGALVPEGWDRARRVWFGSDAPGRPDIGDDPLYDDLLDAVSIIFEPELEHVLALARSLTDIGRAFRVVLLDRVGGRLVERAP